VASRLPRPAIGPGVVYVIDDDEAVLKALRRLIRSVGLEAETFSSAAMFTKRAVSDLPACLVLDVRMTGKTGLDLQSELGEAQRVLPIIFLTGYGDIPMSVRAMKKGAFDFLQKPCDDRELLDAIARALVRSRAGQAEIAEHRELQRRISTLTPREREVLGLVVTGKLNKQIAVELGAAEKTIKVHRGRMMKKMQAESVAELVAMAQKIRLLA
jgi:FixJ family two-component response regulator